VEKTKGEGKSEETLSANQPASRKGVNAILFPFAGTGSGGGMKEGKHLPLIQLKKSSAPFLTGWRIKKEVA